MAYGQFEQFIRNMSRVMGAVNTKLQRDLTMRTRVARRFSMTEVAGLLGVDTTYLTRISSEEPAFPSGEKQGRERTFSPSEIMLIRGIIGSNPAAKRSYLHWRRPGASDARAELVDAAVASGHLTVDRRLTARDLDVAQPHQVRKKQAVADRFDALAAAGRLVPQVSGLRIRTLAERRSDAERADERRATTRRIAAGQFTEPVA